VSGLAAESAGPARLRTVLCTCGGLYGALVLHRLRACERLEICAVIRSSRVLDPRFGFLRGAAAQIRHSGPVYALYLWCVTTLADWLCVVAGIGAVPTRGAAPGPAVLTTRNINDEEGLRFLAACAPDLLVSAYFNQRLHAPALALPKRGCLNIHPSLLPEAKGVDPVFQSLLHGAPPLGVTVHFMTPELDAGRIVAQRPIEGQARASVFATTALLFREGAELLAAAIEPIASGVTGSPQQGAGSYQSWPTRRELRMLRTRGGALLRFGDLVRLVRQKIHSARMSSMPRYVSGVAQDVADRRPLNERDDPV
jgi:folate-dependent phosphoribosylglycinamide formyltransferase PurN